MHEGASLSACPAGCLRQDDGKWLHVKETETIGEGKMFSPGNLRATFDNPAYEKLISYYIGEKYTLRYTGGMVSGGAQAAAAQGPACGRPASGALLALACALHTERAGPCSLRC